jgi:hypothetical protein
MSKQKIREWLVENTGCFYNDNRITMNEAADIIHQYTQEQSGWVSVDDELPENGVEVLFYIAELNQIELGAYKGSKCSWVTPYSDMEHRCGDGWVTHWMPLPLPPTEEA